MRGAYSGCCRQLTLEPSASLASAGPAPYSPAVTESQYLELPDDGYRHELQAGLLLAEPIPKLRHGRIQARLIRIIGAHVERQGSGEVFGEIGFVLARNPDTIRGPDISFLAKARLPELGDGSRFIEGAPDLAIEILSPSNSPSEIHAKVADYLAAGSSLVWVVDPQTRTVTVYRTLLSPRRVESHETLEGDEIVPGLSIPVSAIFGD